jgi:hypothetical protein
MKVINPDTKTDVLQVFEVLFNSKKMKTDAPFMAIVPIKNVNATSLSLAIFKFSI